MLIAALIVTLSLVTMLQFALLSWRAELARIAAQPLPLGLDTPGAPARNLLQSNDFHRLHAYQEVCPDLTGSDGPKLRAVYRYYRFVQSVNALAEAVLPKGWAQGEIELCGRYARVVLCQRLAHNRALLNEFRSC
ncbi:MAG: hypothetical protein LAN59_02435 [Acidobacteriia bacterium]|nr:hypothetical protein [Terriglobia bacterium]